MKRIGIVIGSVRDNRVGIKVGRWVYKMAQNRDHDYQILDLKDFNLPHYNEPSSPRGAKEYKYETTRVWSSAVDSFDAFIFVSPEYNGFFPGSLKDAIDYLYHEWEGKQYGIVGYGGRGAKWAADKLSELLQRFDMKDCGFVGVLKPWDAFDENEDVIQTFLTEDIEVLFSKIEE